MLSVYSRYTQSHTHKETQTMFILTAFYHKRYPHVFMLYFPLDGLHCHHHESLCDSCNQTLTRLHHAVSQHSSSVFGGSLLREHDFCHPPQTRPMTESRAGLSGSLVRLSSHNRKHLRLIEQMLREDLRGSLRPGNINQALSAADQAPCYDNAT